MSKFTYEAKYELIQSFRIDIIADDNYSILLMSSKESDKDSNKINN